MSHDNHQHNHSHGHDHGHHTTSNKKVLFFSFLLITFFMVVEAVGGFLTNSLALISDAGHMLSDAAALGLSLLAFKIGERQATYSKTYGYRRVEIIAAFINGLTLIIISLYIFYEAFQRFIEPPNVSASMMIIAFIGLVVNIVVAWMLMRGDSQENLNIRSALLHVLGDLLGSIGAIVAGILILLFGWDIADPIASVIVAILIVISGIRVTKDSIHILMEGKPTNINVEEVKSKLMELPGIDDVHDFHIWSITSEFPALSCHLVVDNTVDRDKILIQANKLLKKHFSISHSTLQIEGINLHIKNDCNDCSPS
ncbi:cation diffusion facilitator family transporter [Virgibacillus proomii]|uniref:cation diffusion facilitator family transporter n=1 Tax=Virgibacillus proomii TaxID=84407 RepID=UPI001C0FFB78|nr:cation diffusion facilitator family transporter [Virgibacillus proomii]MBU5266494.1 cation diffusion facilitator family transporter [Virgibacillus proomii]